MFYLLSDSLWNDKTAVFAFAFNWVITGDGGYFYDGAMVEDVTALIQKGISIDSQHWTEIGQWKNRYKDITYPEPVEEHMFYAWVDPNYWEDYDPYCVVYTPEEFKILFEDCCRNFVKTHPDRREEFAEALRLNGMSL